MHDDQWKLVPEYDDEKYVRKWAPVILTGIIAVTVIFICLICGETVTSAVTTIWGKS